MAVFCVPLAHGAQAMPNSKDSKALQSCQMATYWCAIVKIIVFKCFKTLQSDTHRSASTNSTNASIFIWQQTRNYLYIYKVLDIYYQRSNFIYILKNQDSRNLKKKHRISWKIQCKTPDSKEWNKDDTKSASDIRFVEHSIWRWAFREWCLRFGWMCWSLCVKSKLQHLNSYTPALSMASFWFQAIFFPSKINNHFHIVQFIEMWRKNNQNNIESKWNFIRKKKKKNISNFPIAKIFR